MPDYEYRDGGLVGDALVEEFVRTAPAHLTPGGAAQLLGNWESRGSVAGLDRVRSWIPADADAWVVEREELSPLAYAELWIRDGGTLPRDAGFSTLLAAWLDDFAAREVTAVGFGYILLRRPRRSLCNRSKGPASRLASVASSAFPSRCTMPAGPSRPGSRHPTFFARGCRRPSSRHPTSPRRGTSCPAPTTRA
ncbi:hypothetical protein [Microbacterium sp. NIBRBAC000506063]|uniref:hypothetical protein n=1 Tax=Microbacterium sp. NIBRBAC000506063 TaxID=2734618 RepID=UPI001CB72527|nr:hypothetical protein [Microbacterium sp. NIBRBAC000506063]